MLMKHLSTSTQQQKDRLMVDSGERKGTKKSRYWGKSKDNLKQNGLYSKCLVVDWYLNNTDVKSIRNYG